MKQCKENNGEDELFIFVSDVWEAQLHSGSVGDESLGPVVTRVDV